MASNKIDLVMGDLTVTPERIKIIDFTVPFQTDNSHVVKRKPTFHNSSLFTVFKPMSLEVWIAVFVSLITGQV